jgi:hypothetical protein
LIFAFITTAYFWIPSFFEKGYTMVNLLTEELANYQQHFVCLPQFWNSPWGYGGSVAGCIADGMSFQIGKIQTLLFLLSILTVVGLLSVKKTRTLGIMLLIRNLSGTRFRFFGTFNSPGVFLFSFPFSRLFWPDRLF